MVCASAANGRDAHSAIARRRAPRARVSASRAGLRDDALIAPAGDRSRSRVTTLLARVLNRVRVDDAAREDASPFGEARETARKTPILLSSSLAGETRASRMARADARRAARLSLARKKSHAREPCVTWYNLYEQPVTFRAIAFGRGGTVEDTISESSVF
jgi:hypothetical protein